MLRTKENKQKKAIHEALENHQEALERARARAVMSQQEYNEYHQRRVNEYLDAGGFQKGDAIPVIVLDYDPKEQRLEDTAREHKVEVQRLEQRISLLQKSLG
jgi:hypothetical protein